MYTEAVSTVLRGLLALAFARPLRARAAAPGPVRLLLRAAAAGPPNAEPGMGGASERCSVVDTLGTLDSLTRPCVAPAAAARVDDDEDEAALVSSSTRYRS